MSRRSHSRVRPGSGRSSGPLGIALDLPSVWFLAALNDLIEGNYSTVEQVLLLTSYALIVYAAGEIPIVLKIIWPDKSSALSSLPMGG
jgi:hypothetical protein